MAINKEMINKSFSNKDNYLNPQNISEKYILSKDNIKLYYKKWQTNNDLKGSIILIHGFGEHIGRYNEWCKKFTEAGFNIHGIDLRGHGKSNGKRGFSPNYKSYLKDLYLLYQIVNENSNNKPIILYGHSFGGNLAINFLLDYPTLKVDAAVISSPWLKLSFNPSFLKVFLGNIFKHIFPKAVVKTNLPINGLTSKKDIINNYINDPLVHQKIGLKIYFQIKSAGTKALKQVYKINIPMLIIHGINDPITSHVASINFSKNSSKKVTLKLYNHPYHELHNTNDSDKIFDDIIKWLLEKIT